MRILVTGNGGREHAIIKSLLSSKKAEIFCCPGSDGIKEAQKVSCDLNNADEFKITLKDLKIDLVIVGPENHLVQGVADWSRELGVPCVGPNKNAAQLESSKIFAKEFMASAGVPTPPFAIVQSVSDLENAASQFTPPYVLKADGLAAGKGVVICETVDDLLQQGRKYFEEKIFGEAGTKAILEEFQSGFELSYFILTNSESYQALPLAQDHKKLLENDRGPNTGGMGAIAPIPLTPEQNERIVKEILEPSVKELKKQNFIYNGVLFVGIMVTDKGPQVIEYNVRLGDPEAQVLLPLLENDWAEVFYNLAQGTLSPLQWKSSFAACVVLAAPGYPAQPKKGLVIKGSLEDQKDHYFLHAGTQYDSTWKTKGGRVLNAIGLGSNFEEALQKAYAQAQQVNWEGLQIRKDIGHQWTK